MSIFNKLAFWGKTSTKTYDTKMGVNVNTQDSSMAFTDEIATAILDNNKMYNRIKNKDQVVTMNLPKKDCLVMTKVSSLFAGSSKSAGDKWFWIECGKMFLNCVEKNVVNACY